MDKRSLPGRTVALGIAIIATLAVVLYVTFTSAEASSASKDVPEIGPLPSLESPDPELVALGKMLFFDNRLSGDAGLSCATCHEPEKGWADGKPLSKAYPGTRYFRNAKSLLNIVYAKYFYWDGRLSGSDMETQVRDAITETHFLNMDGRILLERLKQVPEYVDRFKRTLGGEPSFGRTLKAVAAFEKTLVSRNVPFDKGTLSESAQRGRALFEGKARCVQCHNGPYFSDSRAHNIGVPHNPDIIQDPLRHITLRSFSKFMGVLGFENLRKDPGFFAVTKEPTDWGKFVTPTLRELAQTAPYMHNGIIATLDEVVEFYNRGGGDGENKSPLIRPLELNESERRDLVAFLLGLSGDPLIVEKPVLPEYELIENWHVVDN